MKYGHSASHFTCESGHSSVILISCAFVYPCVRARVLNPIPMQVVILDILYHLLTHSIQEGLGCQCMQAMKSHMQSDNGTIREKATRCVMQLWLVRNSANTVLLVRKDMESSIAARLHS